MRWPPGESGGSGGAAAPRRSPTPNVQTSKRQSIQRSQHLKSQTAKRIFLLTKHKHTQKHTKHTSRIPISQNLQQRVPRPGHALVKSASPRSCPTSGSLPPPEWWPAWPLQSPPPRWRACPPGVFLAARLAAPCSASGASTPRSSGYCVGGSSSAPLLTSTPLVAGPWSSSPCG